MKFFLHFSFKKIITFTLCLFFVTGGLCQKKQRDFSPKLVKYVTNFRLDHQEARRDLGKLTASPHIFGSKQQLRVADYLYNRATQLGLIAYKSPFTAKVPNRALSKNPHLPANRTLTKKGVNILAFTGSKEKRAECVVAIGSHFDTKLVEGTRYLGANDSGSSTIALLQILRAAKDFAKIEPLRCEIVGFFFDGEESVLDGWHDGTRRHPANITDHTYGSRYEAGRLRKCGEPDGKKSLCLPKSYLGGPRLVALILVDMVGSANIKITRDQNSTPRLRALLKRADQALFEESILWDGPPQPIEDDHIPFLDRGLEAIDIIDFTHLEYWHKAGDDPEKISFTSIEKAAKLALMLALELGR